jgi:hypothetical protein
VFGDEVFQAAGALLLGALHDQLEVHRHLVAEGAQRGEVHEDVALAVGGAPPVPAAVDLGQLERRGPPGVLVQWRLDVVVGIEQHRGGGRVRARPGAVDGLAAVGGLLQPQVGEADLGEVVQHPLGGPGALGGWELAGVGH